MPVGSQPLRLPPTLQRKLISKKGSLLMSLKVTLILSENWTMLSPRHLRTLVDWAVIAEEEGVDSVMISEHIALGPSADSQGRMANLRDYVLPNNQDPTTSWPSSLILLSAIAARTTHIRLVAGALIAPLRHPVQLAKDLRSEERRV